MSVVTAFNGASQSYDAAAELQTEVALQLLSSTAIEAPRTILDIGCGTGILTALAQQRWPYAKITALDAAPAMLAVARAKLPRVQFVQADAAEIPFGETFDLVLSSMVLHWLAEPVDVLARWGRSLAPCGSLLVAVPVEGGLAEWDALCTAHSVPNRLWRFPPASLFDGKLRHHRMAYASARAFLRSMKNTGAASPDPTTAPTSPVALRRLLQTAPRPFAATFHIAYVTQTKTGPHF